jgi:hypothetical protein
MCDFVKAGRVIFGKIAGSVLSYGVAGACGAIASMTVVVWNDAQKTESYRIGEDSGIAYPGPMFDNAKNEGYNIVFRPADLQRVAVCEWSVARGRNWWEFSRDYLAKYPECFITRSVSEKTVEVYPQTTNGSWSGLKQNPRNKSYWCKCPPEISGVE